MIILYSSETDDAISNQLDQVSTVPLLFYAQMNHIQITISVFPCESCILKINNFDSIKTLIY